MKTEELMRCVEDIQKKTGRDANKAMQALINQFKPYMTKTATKLDPKHFEDAYQAAVEGLFYAAREYDMKSNTKFFTYAYTCIRGYVNWYIRDMRVIHMTNKEYAELTRPGNEDKLYNATNLVSLDTPIDDGEGRETDLIDMIGEDGIYGDECDQFEQVSEDDLERLYYNEEYTKAQNAAVKFLEEHVFSCDNLKPKFKGGPTHIHDGEIFCKAHGILNRLQMPIKEIAELYNMPESTVRAKVDRIQEILADNLELCGYEPFSGPEAIGTYSGPDEDDKQFGPLFAQHKFPGFSLGEKVV